MLWLKSDLLLPLDKGGKLRTWHLMRQLARRHEITYLAFAEPGAPGRPTSMGCARSPRTSKPFRALEPRERDAALLPRRGDAPRRSAAVRRRASTDRRPFAAGCGSCSTEQRFDLIVCDFLFPGGEPAAAAALSGGDLHAQRRVGDLAPARGDEKRRPRPRCSTRRSIGACSDTKAARSRRFDGVLAVSDADRDSSRASIPAPSPGRFTSCRPASTRSISRRRPQLRLRRHPPTT